MDMTFVRGMMPFLVLCGILVVFIAANFQGTPVSWMLFGLNGFGLVLALYHGLEFRLR
jgi:hypothetical protein